MRKCGMFSLPVDNVRARLGFGLGIYGWIVFVFLICERRERVKRSKVMILPLLLCFDAFSVQIICRCAEVFVKFRTMKTVVKNLDIRTHVKCRE